jgi:predicted nucleotidyltransferase
MNSFDYPSFLDVLKDVLSQDQRALFAYLYGSFAESKKGNDIDIAVYAIDNQDPHGLSADLKIALHKKSGLPIEMFDIRIVNDLAKKSDIFGLLYLKNILEEKRLLLDRHPFARADFLEQYGSRFRECEGLMQEILG